MYFSRKSVEYNAREERENLLNFNQDFNSKFDEPSTHITILPPPVPNNFLDFLRVSRTFFFTFNNVIKEFSSLLNNIKLKNHVE